MNFKLEFSVGFQALVAISIVAVLMVACGGGGGGGSGSSSSSSTPIENVNRNGTSPLTAIPTPPTPGNVVPITIDAGPPGASEINIAYVSVTVCTPSPWPPGITAACQTIDHVMLDTGSSGLRLLNFALDPNLSLQPVTNSNGAIGECMVFADGISWGSVQTADVYLGGEVAQSVPIQIIGDKPGGVSGVPRNCSNYGVPEDTQAMLGANGILGVGLFTNDCDICLTQPISAAYYTCTATGCTNSTVTSAQVVQNPVALFLQDNNGVLIDLPAVSAAGASILNGSLIFGIGTQSNNQLGSATVYATDQYGNFITNFNGANTSYIDSGSNALFFYDSNIPICPVTTWAYCPPSPTFLKSLSATNSAATTGTPSGMVNFSIVNADHLDVSIVAANIGGTSTPGQFDWGLPFFFGRKVFTAISGMGTPGPSGPYFAY
jgi:hypothetical protein